MTPRLLLRPRQRADLDDQVALDSDPEISMYADVDVRIRTTGRNPGEVRKRLKAEITQRTQLPSGVWVIEWRDRPGFLGVCGLQPFTMTASMTLYFRIVRTAWSQGVATEAARAVLAHGFERLKLPTITALVHPDNQRSRRVVEKCGLRYDGLVLIGPQSVLNPQSAPAKGYALGALAAQPMYTNRFLCFRLNQTNYAEAMADSQPSGVRVRPIE
ncbi:MAG TPA: GNAT family N-acetyltransferase [Candidatus Binataceae bacterium]|nr:GNAT family N-acetyltransferase [Candidatus Binataceae bacterium]